MKDFRVDTFQNRLTIAMNKMGKRAIDITETTGIGKSAISQYLAGKNVPKTDKVYVLADALDVQPAWLLGYDVPMKESDPQSPSSVAVNDVKLLTKFAQLSESEKTDVLNYIDFLLSKHV